MKICDNRNGEKIVSIIDGIFSESFPFIGKKSTNNLIFIHNVR